MPFHQIENSQGNYAYNICVYTDKIWNYHFHKNLELIYVMEGAVDCTVNQLSYRLTSGEYGLCLPYDIHRYAPERDTKYWVLVFSGDYVRFFMNQIKEKTGQGFAFRLDETADTYIKDRLITQETPTDYTLKSCLYAVCEGYLAAVKLQDRKESTVQPSLRICDYIYENHTRKVTLSDISKVLGYDYSYVSRYFRNVFRMTFSDFLLGYRLETAIRLLEETDKAIAEVAYESGFQSVRSFNSLFQKHMNTTPSQYRKTSREEGEK